MMPATMANAFLISVRLLPVLVASPVMFFAHIPVLIRLLMCVILAAVMAGSLASQSEPMITPAALAGELMLGVMISFGYHAAQAAVDVAGKLLDTQIGLNAAGVFDPATSVVSGMLGQLLTLGLSLLFVTLDLHHNLLQMFSHLLTAVAPGSVTLPLLSFSVASVLTQQFVLAFISLLPVLLALWLTDVAFALMSRSMPQANIYFLALPVKLAVGVIVLVLSLPLIVEQMPQLFTSAMNLGGHWEGAL